MHRLQFFKQMLQPRSSQGFLNRLKARHQRLHGRFQNILARFGHANQLGACIIRFTTHLDDSNGLKPRDHLAHGRCRYVKGGSQLRSRLISYKIESVQNLKLAGCQRVREAVIQLTLGVFADNAHEPKRSIGHGGACRLLNHLVRLTN